MPPAPRSAARRRTSVRPQRPVAEAVPSSFAAQLGAALGELAEAHARWVLCFTPNAQQLPRTFDARAVLAQLNAAAVDPPSSRWVRPRTPERLLDSLAYARSCGRWRLPSGPPSRRRRLSTRPPSAAAWSPIRDFQLGSSTIFFRRGRAGPPPPPHPARGAGEALHESATPRRRRHRRGRVGRRRRQVCAPLAHGVARAPSRDPRRRRPSAAPTLPCAILRGPRRFGNPGSLHRPQRRRRPPSRWWRPRGAQAQLPRAIRHDVHRAAAAAHARAAFAVFRRACSSGARGRAPATPRTRHA